MALGIIGTGFGRTGTDSLSEALTILGFGPCHQMHEIRDNPEKAQPWHDYFCGGTPLDLDLFLKVIVRKLIGRVPIFGASPLSYIQRRR